MLSKIWNWIISLFKSKQEEPIEEIDIKFNNKEKELKVQERPSLKEVAKKVKEKVTGKSEEAKGPNYAIKIPAGHLNREMRRFLAKMGWTNPRGGIIAPRATTPELWKALSSIQSAKINLPMKRKAFKRSFGK
jgi:hypothetical protein